MGHKFSRLRKKRASNEVVSKKDIIINDLNKIDTNLNELNKELGEIYIKKKDDKGYIVNELNNLDYQLRLLQKDVIFLKDNPSKGGNLDKSK
jgi:hypothetical protein